jgi:hypothetical protein
MQDDTSDHHPSWPVLCPVHPSAPAIALCTRCSRFLCSRCRSLDENDLAVCPDCRPVVVDELSGNPAGASRGNLTWILRTAWLAISRPAHFVNQVPRRGELGPAMRFGVFTIVLGKLAFLLWILLLQREDYMAIIQPLCAEMGLSVKAYLLFQILFLPLDALMRLALFALLLMIGVRLVAGLRDLKYREVLQLFAFASAGYLWLLIPSVPGMALAFAFVLTFTARILREHHALTMRQSIFAMAPMAMFLLLLDFDFFGGF